MNKPIRPIDKLAQGYASCFGSHRQQMERVMNDFFTVRKYCAQFPDSQYHVTMMERCKDTCDREIRKHITEKKLKEHGCAT